MQQTRNTAMYTWFILENIPGQKTLILTLMLTLDKHLCGIYLNVYINPLEKPNMIKQLARKSNVNYPANNIVVVTTGERRGG